MSFVQLNLNPQPKILRQFGFIALGGFGLLAFLAWKEKAIFAGGLGDARETVTYALLGLGLISIVFSLVYPRANRPLFVALSVIAYPIGIVLSYVIMGFLFFIVFGVVALILKIVGRDSMHRRYNSALASYWAMKEKQAEGNSYFRQF